MSRRPSQLLEFVRAFPFGLLLVALFLMIVGAPISAEVAHHVEGIQGPAGLAPFTILLTVASAYAVWNIARHRAMVIVAAGLILTIIGVSSVIEHRGLNIAHVAAQTIFLVYVTATILRAVFRARVVDGNILCGAACVYLLAGTVWGYSYAMLEIANHGSFKIVAPDMANGVNLYDEPGWLVYFSFTTLTTVGFGDVLPASAFARSLSVLEAVVGQIMLVVMMARLVGLHVAHTTAPREHAKFSTDE